MLGPDAVRVFPMGAMPALRPRPPPLPPAQPAAAVAAQAQADQPEDGAGVGAAAAGGALDVGGGFVDDIRRMGLGKRRAQIALLTEVREAS
jgi:hypothetical protein